MRNTTVLYSVLDWGLGHATRSIPVIKALLKLGCRVIIAGEGKSLHLLKQEFPGCESATITGFNVRYPEKNMRTWLIKNLPAMFRAFKNEKNQTAALVKKYQPDLIISDHRYGFFHPGIPSVLIAHQLRIRAGYFTGALLFLHKFLLRNFREIWVPDFAIPPGLSGELAHHSSLQSLPLHYTGPLTRLQDITATNIPNYDILLLLSGPEPQRSILENACIAQLKDSAYKIIALRGIPDTNESTIGSIRLCGDATAESIRNLIIHTPVIICRSGYSTLMDLAACGRNAILVPTSGQTEQEYLANLHRKNGFLVQEQQGLDLVTALRNFKPLHLPFLPASNLDEMLSERLAKLVNQ